MTRRFDARDASERGAALTMAAAVIRRGGLVVLPTDTVYAVAADAFTPAAVHALLESKRRPATTPVPIMVSSPATLDGVCASLSDQARALVQAFWPGSLTLIAPMQPSLAWDIGNTGGTVSVRMPLHPFALELLRRTGPLAVMAANAAGSSPPLNLDAALADLGDRIEVGIDAGERPEVEASTIVDVTTPVPVVLRQGSIDIEALRRVVPEIQVHA